MKPDILSNLVCWTEKAASRAERLLAVAILVGVVVFAFFSIRALSVMDWSSSETFYEMVYRTLLLVIGVELARTLLTHDLEAILELLAFVVARKMLKPDVTAPDIFMSVAAFCILIAARHYFLRPSAPST